jgi:hypothetical protein
MWARHRSPLVGACPSVVLARSRRTAPRHRGALPPRQSPVPATGSPRTDLSIAAWVRVVFAAMTAIVAARCCAWIPAATAAERERAKYRMEPEQAETAPLRTRHCHHLHRRQDQQRCLESGARGRLLMPSLSMDRVTAGPFNHRGCPDIMLARGRTFGLRPPTRRDQPGSRSCLTEEGTGQTPRQVWATIPAAWAPGAGSARGARYRARPDNPPCSGDRRRCGLWRTPQRARPR